MGDLVIRIVVDILREICVKNFELFGVLRISGSPRNFVVLNAAKLVILNPKISFEDFSSSSEPEQSSIAFVEMPVPFFVLLSGQVLRKSGQCVYQQSRQPWLERQRHSWQSGDQ